MSKVALRQSAIYDKINVSDFPVPMKLGLRMPKSVLEEIK
ncbi:AlpA family transcriptional regulator [Marinobacter sp. F3R08]|nr:AlpA family transcriptional regulator [Marinobacter sp. F3R08]